MIIVMFFVVIVEGLEETTTITTTITTSSALANATTLTTKASTTSTTTIKSNPIICSPPENEKAHWELAQKILHVATASISDPAKECLQNEKSGYTAVHDWTFRKPPSKTNWHEIRIGISKRDDPAEILVFVSGPPYIVQTMQANMREIDDQKLVPFRPYCNHGVRVGNVMSDLYHRIYDQDHQSSTTLKSTLKQLHKKYGKTHSISFSGFSTGGCVAQMLALVTEKDIGWRDGCIRFYGFGMPRCGDQRYVMMIHEKIPQNYRYYWKNDPMSSHPKKSSNESIVCDEEALQLKPNGEVTSCTSSGSGEETEDDAEICDWVNSVAITDHYAFFDNLDPNAYSSPSGCPFF
ncbi:unnamed protein product, partial [Mesorhabditis belari]|uniref:Fungal lipase-like domain-containing protein n=1 Tax=Mesorhabditis belari TaxID=2138241 RepID=A0AAF3F1W7_9BILA